MVQKGILSRTFAAHRNMASAFGDPFYNPGRLHSKEIKYRKMIVKYKFSFLI